ncbi:hypothetical protein PPERSA_04809 [Pseudocohnilembus persalinus]|uniref:Uncharacterized protein n=1 Tax=Pseudocohnilembus persalinus TaxID=266149 RepID=A0A0V0QLB1_PSEPJ|nr:hypothetical protein PPERSA_04809 [Pseudocohnilembus persalinus]|eukprot:KRX03014.1 hypothetical protein PPERSA_04809 [Pseudocohnilembus persalinus]
MDKQKSPQLSKSVGALNLTTNFKELQKKYKFPKPTAKPITLESDLLISSKKKKYSNIQSKMFKINFNKQDVNQEILNKVKTSKEKFVVNRKVLNDYLSIAHRGVDMLDKIKQDLKVLDEESDKNLAYLNKTYSNQYVDGIKNLFENISPEHKYSLKSIVINAENMRKLGQNAINNVEKQEEEDKKTRQSSEKNNGTQNNINEIKNANLYFDGNQKKQIDKEQRILKTKGYLIENDVDLERQRRHSEVVQLNNKPGAYHLKLNLFNQDMKQKHTQKQDKIIIDCFQL